MVDQLGSFASEVTRVAREVGTEGELGGQAAVPGVAGTWKYLTDSVIFVERSPPARSPPDRRRWPCTSTTIGTSANAVTVYYEDNTATSTGHFC